MLTPEELRIGNIVFVLGHLEQIREVHADGVKVSDDAPCLLETVKPVELDGDIFKACGFEKWIDIYEYPLKRYFPFMLHKRHGDKESTYGYTLLYDYKVVSVKQILFLHELQNLYFALSGKELQIKFKPTQE